MNVYFKFILSLLHLQIEEIVGCRHYYRTHFSMRAYPFFHTVVWPACENQYFHVRAGRPHRIIDYPVRSNYNTTCMKTKKPKIKKSENRRPPAAGLQPAAATRRRCRRAATRTRPPRSPPRLVTSTSHGRPVAAVTSHGHLVASPLIPPAAAESRRGTATAVGSRRGGWLPSCPQSRRPPPLPNPCRGWPPLPDPGTRGPVEVAPRRCPVAAPLANVHGRRRLASSTTKVKRGEE